LRRLLSFGAQLSAIQAGRDMQGCRRLAVAVFVVQALGAVAAALTHLMLHGDGSYFVYTLCVGKPWLLKWAGLADRISVYITTVIPTEWLGQAFHLSPLGIADLNGFIFYMVPALQFLVAMTLVWRSNPQYLLFPISQYILSSSLSFGFPTEILLAPGFLWICLFLTSSGRVPGFAFLISLCGLVFSHELALPSAMVAIFLALQAANFRDHTRSEHWRTLAVSISSASILVLYMYVRLAGGGAGSDSNAIYVFDPRRVLAYPSLWIVIVTTILASFLFARFSSRSNGRAVWTVAIIVAATLPVLLRFTVPAFDFDLGRYDSGRTVIGLAMFFLSVAFALLHNWKEKPLARVPFQTNRILFALVVAFATSIGTGTAFMIDWTTSLQGLNRVVLARTAKLAPTFIAASGMGAYLDQNEESAFNRIGYFWALPYRSIVLANGHEPAHIIYGPVNYLEYCHSAHYISAQRSIIPASTLDELKDFTCNYIAPPPQHATRDKIMALVRDFITWLNTAFPRPITLFGQHETRFCPFPRPLNEGTLN